MTNRHSMMEDGGNCPARRYSYFWALCTSFFLGGSLCGLDPHSQLTPGVSRLLSSWLQNMYGNTPLRRSSNLWSCKNSVCYELGMVDQQKTKSSLQQKHFRCPLALAKESQLLLLQFLHFRLVQARKDGGGSKGDERKSRRKRANLSR